MACYQALFARQMKFACCVRYRDMLLAKMKNARILASEGDRQVASGNWREEHLFALKQAMALYDNYGTLLTECDTKLESMLATFVGDDDSDPGRGRRALNSKNAPQLDVRTCLFRLCGVDLTRINGINQTTALKVFAEVGPDMSRFKSAKHFTDRLGLCPGTKISGGKALSGACKRTTNRAAQSLWLSGHRTSQKLVIAWEHTSDGLRLVLIEPRRLPPSPTN